MPAPIEYCPPATPRPERSLGKWLLLLAVWTGGVVVWAVYFVVIVIVLLKVL